MEILERKEKNQKINFIIKIYVFICKFMSEKNKIQFQFQFES